jgi:hypothetical protein
MRYQTNGNSHTSEQDGAGPDQSRGLPFGRISARPAISSCRGNHGWHSRRRYRLSSKYFACQMHQAGSQIRCSGDIAARQPMRSLHPTAMTSRFWVFLQSLRHAIATPRRCFRLERAGVLKRRWKPTHLICSNSVPTSRFPLPRSRLSHCGCGCSSGVEHDLAKVGVEGSNPFARSNFSPKSMRYADA